MSENNDTVVFRCFVIGPIGNKFAPIGDPARDAYEDAIDVFENVIVPACQSVGIDPVRADQISLTGEITEQVFRHLHDDEIVIADVSGGNANVMYELGLRHTRPLLTIQIGEFGQLPFDVSAVRTIQFSRSPRGLVDARKALQRALEVGIAEPVQHVTATRVWRSGVDTPDQEPTGGVDDGREAKENETFEDQAGFLDHLADIEATLPSLAETSEKIGQVVAAMGAVATDATQTMALANASGAPTAQRLGIVGKFASDLQPSADQLLSLTTRFHREMESLDGQLVGIFTFAENHPQMTKGSDFGGFLESIIGMTRSSREAMENINQFGVAMDGLASMSRVLRRPATQVAQAVRQMLSGIELTDAWERAALRLKQQRASIAASGPVNLN